VRQRLDDERRVLRRADPVEDDAGNLDVVPVRLETERDGGGRLCLCLNVEHQHHGPAGQSGKVGGRAVAAGTARAGAIEKAHDALGDADLRVAGSIA
jgi:hypothetical protein